MGISLSQLGKTIDMVMQKVFPYLHEHDNDDVLDSLSEDASGNLVYGEKSITVDNTEINTHLENTTIHISKEEKEKISSHLEDTDFHVTSDDKKKWNKKYDKPTAGIPKTDLHNDLQYEIDDKVNDDDLFDTEGLIYSNLVNEDNINHENLTNTGTYSHTDLDSHIENELIHATNSMGQWVFAEAQYQSASKTNIIVDDDNYIELSPIIGTEPQEYETSGEIISVIFDTGIETCPFTNLLHYGQYNTYYHTIKVYTRTGTTEAYSSSNWEDWKQVSVKSEIQSSANQFIQIKVTIDNADRFSTPIMKKFIVYYGVDMSEELSAARGDFTTINDRLLDIEDDLEEHIEDTDIHVTKEVNKIITNFSEGKTGNLVYKDKDLFVDVDEMNESILNIQNDINIHKNISKYINTELDYCFMTGESHVSIPADTIVTPYLDHIKTNMEVDEDNCILLKANKTYEIEANMLNYYSTHFAYSIINKKTNELLTGMGGGSAAANNTKWSDVPAKLVITPDEDMYITVTLSVVGGTLLHFCTLTVKEINRAITVDIENAVSLSGDIDYIYVSSGETTQSIPKRMPHYYENPIIVDMSTIENSNNMNLNNDGYIMLKAGKTYKINSGIFINGSSTALSYSVYMNDKPIGRRNRVYANNYNEPYSSIHHPVIVTPEEDSYIYLGITHSNLTTSIGNIHASSIIVEEIASKKVIGLNYGGFDYTCLWDGVCTTANTEIVLSDSIQNYDALLVYCVYVDNATKKHQMKISNLILKREYNYTSRYDNTTGYMVSVPTADSNRRAIFGFTDDNTIVCGKIELNTAVTNVYGIKGKVDK